MRYGLLSRKFGQKEAESAENPTEKKKAREQRIKYFTLMVYEDADATLLRLFECFMESAPQLILQVKKFKKRDWITEKNAEKLPIDFSAFFLWKL